MKTLLKDYFSFICCSAVVVLGMVNTAIASEWLLGNWKDENADSKKPIELFIDQSPTGRIFGFLYSTEMNCVGNLEQYDGGSDRWTKFTVTRDANCERPGLVGSMMVIKKGSSFNYSYTIYGQKGGGKLISAQVSAKMAGFVADNKESNKQVKPSLLAIKKGFPYASDVEIVALEKYQASFDGVFLFQNALDSCFIQFKSTKEDLSTLNEKSRTGDCGFMPNGVFHGYKPGDYLRLLWIPTNLPSIQTIFSGARNPSILARSLRRSVISSGSINEAVASYQTRIDRFDNKFTSMSKTAVTTKPDPLGLVGNWSGEINFGNFVAEFNVTLWPTYLSTYSRVGGVGGFLSIEDQCQLGIMLHQNSATTTFYLTYSFSQFNLCDGKAYPLTGKKNRGQVILEPQNNTIMLTILKDSEGECDETKEFCIFPALATRSPIKGMVAEMLVNKTKMIPSHPEGWGESILISGKAPTSALIEAQSKSWLAAQRAEEEDREKSLLARQKYKQEEKERLRKERIWKAKIDDEHSRNGPPPPEPAYMSGPFDEVRGATFLNAIYHGKFQTINELNQYESYKKIAGYDAFWGNSRDEVTDIFRPALKNIKVEESLTAIYLFRYQERYTKCLKDDKATFYVSGYQPGTVVENLLGVEVWRTFGKSYSYQYFINQEFIPVFRIVGKLTPEGIYSQGLDIITNTSNNKNLRTEAMAGVREIMQQFNCNSPEVKQFESNLIKLFR